MGLDQACKVLKEILLALDLVTHQLDCVKTDLFNLFLAQILVQKLSELLKIRHLDFTHDHLQNVVWHIELFGCLEDR